MTFLESSKAHQFLAIKPFFTEKTLDALLADFRVYFSYLLLRVSEEYNASTIAGGLNPNVMGVTMLHQSLKPKKTMRDLWEPR